MFCLGVGGEKVVRRSLAVWLRGKQERGFGRFVRRF